MSDLTPDDEALLARARVGLSPGPDDHARIKRRLLVQIAAGSVAATAALSTSAEAAVTTGAGLFSALAKVLAIGVLGSAVVASAVGAGIVATQHPSNQAATRYLPAAASGSSAGAIQDLPDDEDTVPPSATGSAAAARPPADSDRPKASLATPSRPRSAATMPPSVPVPVAGPSTLVAEAALLRRADAALKAGDAARALELVDAHATSYPNGVLIEEREAERVVVLSSLGRDHEARVAGWGFLRDHPRSTQAARVRAACGSP